MPEPDQSNRKESTKPKRTGRDEMNLVEYPFSSLLPRGGGTGESPSVILLEWENYDEKNHCMVQATWRVTGDSELGLPTPFDERLYLVMMQITREQGMVQTVTFSAYDVLRRMGRDTNSDAYEDLQNAFRRLKGVVINTENCFYSKKTKGFKNVGFNLIDTYAMDPVKSGRKKKKAVTPETEETPSWFKWSDTVYESMGEGYIKTINVEFALSLQKPLSMRLYRYLDKKRHLKEMYQVSLRTLCLRHLGMSDAAYESQLKQRLVPAHNELAARGFISGISFLPMKTQSGEKIVYTFGDELPVEKAIKAKPVPKEKPAQLALLEDPDDKPTPVEDLCEARLQFLEDERNEEYGEVRQAAIATMGQLERDRLQRDPMGTKTLYNLRRRMLDEIKERYFKEE